jgi:CheY-like chemotaxis protein
VHPGTVRILYADDDRNDLALMGIAVEHSDLDIWLQTAGSGGEAVDWLEGRGPFGDRSLFPLPHLILLNLRMPELSGFEFLDWRARSAHRGIPVIGFSGANDNVDQTRSLAMGAEAFLSKPNAFEEWKACVLELWQLGKRFLPERLAASGEGSCLH